MPAPQDGHTPADLAAQYNGNAEVKAFFASGQVRPIRVHSEGTRRALRGHSPCAERVRPCVRACVCSQHLQATPTTLATTRFIDSYNQPERIPDQLYALMATAWPLGAL